MRHSSGSRGFNDWLEKVANKFPPVKMFSMYEPSTEQFQPEKLDNLETFRSILNAYFRVEFVGADLIPKTGGALLVGNHGRTGLDSFVFAGLGLDKIGRPIRGLAEKNLFRLPGFKEWVAEVGAVPGTRSNAIRMLEAGELVLVYPGGTKEVMKREDQDYKLLWGDRLGFIIVALEAGVPIIPFAGIGVEELFQKLSKWDSIENSRLVKILELVTRKSIREVPQPLVGVGKSPLPVPVRLSFRMSEPMSVAGLDRNNKAQLLEFQRRVRDRVRQLIAEGLAERGSSDPS